MVRRSLKSCLKIARILLLEREMFRFFMPEMDLFKISSASNPAAEDSEEEDALHLDCSTDAEECEEVMDMNADVLCVE